MKKQLLPVLLTLIVTSAMAQSTQEIAEKYLALYTSMKFDELGEFYTDESVFEDPTTSFFDPSGSYEKKLGREDITAFLKDGFAKISNVEFKIEKQFSAGVIFYSYGILNYDYMMNREGKDVLLKIKLPLTIILEFKDGKVIHHQDIADYNEWYSQYKEQIQG